MKDYIQEVCNRQSIKCHTSIPFPLSYWVVIGHHLSQGDWEMQSIRKMRKKDLVSSQPVSTRSGHLLPSPVHSSFAIHICVYGNNVFYKVVSILVIVGANNNMRQEIEEFLVICCQPKHILSVKYFNLTKMGIMKQRIKQRYVVMRKEDSQTENGIDTPLHGPPLVHKIQLQADNRLLSLNFLTPASQQIIVKTMWRLHIQK